MTLIELRKNLKDIGFKVSVKTFGSLGKRLIFKDHLGMEYPTIFTSESLEYWAKLTAYLKENKAEITELRKEIN